MMIARFVRVFTLIAVLILGAVPLFASFCVPATKPPQPPPLDPPPPVCEPKKCDRCSKSPCYVSTGTYVNDFVDLQISTGGTYPLTISRRYDSSRPGDGPLGIGWSSSLTAHLYYATYLVSAPSTYSYEADIVMPDGVIYRFTTTGSGGFTPPFGRYDMLVKNGDGSYSLTLQHTRSVYRFNADGSIASLTDDYGNVITYTNDASGRVQRMADSAGSGRYIDVTWGADGRIASLTDSTGRVLKYFYENGNGTLSSFSDPLVASDSSSRSAYYSYVSGRFGPVISRIADRWHRVISDLAWYPNGKLKSYTDGAFDDASPATSAGEKYTYEYYPAGFQPYTTKSHSLSSTSYYYDFSGLVDPTLYANGQPTTVITPGLGFFQYEYDSLGRVTKKTTPSPEPYSYGSGSAVWWYTYDPAWPEQVASTIPKDIYGNLKTNWAGMVYDYYPVGSPSPGALCRVWRVRSDTTTKDLVATFSYNSHGRVVGTTDDNGVATAYEYNAAGDQTSVTTSGFPSVTHISYDALGRPVSVTDPNGHTTSTTYDALGRTTSVTLPKPSTISTYDTVTTYSYDNYDSSSGLVFVNTTDPNGRITKAGYDALGHVKQTIDSAGNVTQFTYLHDLLQKVRDPNGNETSYTYSATRDVASTTFPDGATERYDVSSGVLTSFTDRRGNTVRYTYDGLGRVYSAFYDGRYNNSGGQVGVRYLYDGQRLAEFDDWTQAVANHNYTYDSSWRLTVDDLPGAEKKTFTYGSTSGSLLGSYTIQPPSGTNTPTQSVSYTYGPDGLPTSETWNWATNPFTFQYTPSGQYSLITFPNGQQRRFTYDNQDRLMNINNTSPSGGTIASFDYGYDYDWQTSTYAMLGQRTSVSVTAPGTNIVNGLTKYSYDGRYQLARADYPNNTYEALTYDAIGNRISRHYTYGSTFPYYYFTNTAGANTHRLRNDSSYDFSYDAAGNTTSMSSQYGSTAYTWDYANRLASYGNQTYSYDAFGRTSTTANGSTTRYIRLNGNTVGERNAAGGVTTDYIFGPGIDEPLAKRMANGTVSYFGVDGLGSVVTTTNAAGTVLSSTGYSPWGELSILPSQELFGYTGREVGGPSWYYRARYYDAARGRFVSEDPLYSASGRFQYVANVYMTSGMWTRGRFSLWFENGFDSQLASLGGTPSVYAYAQSSPIANTDPEGLGVMGRANPLCWYWIWRCSEDGTQCRKDLQCKFDKMTEEQQYETLQEAGVSSESGYYAKKCFNGQPSCRKMLKQCARPPNPGQRTY